MSTKAKSGISCLFLILMVGILSACGSKNGFKASTVEDGLQREVIVAEESGSKISIKMRIECNSKEEAELAAALMGLAKSYNSEMDDVSIDSSAEDKFVVVTFVGKPKEGTNIASTISELKEKFKDEGYTISNL